MPTYHFKCSNCSREVEYIDSMKNTRSTLFRICTCDSVEHIFNKIIKTTPVHFKGKGWVDKE